MVGRGQAALPLIGTAERPSKSAVTGRSTQAPRAATENFQTAGREAMDEFISLVDQTAFHMGSFFGKMPRLIGSILKICGFFIPGILLIIVSSLLNATLPSASLGLLIAGVAWLLLAFVFLVAAMVKVSDERYKQMETDGNQNMSVQTPHLRVRY